MKLEIDDVKKLIKTGAIKTSILGSSKGSTVVIYKGKSFYVWKGHKYIFFNQNGSGIKNTFLTFQKSQLEC